MILERERSHQFEPAFGLRKLVDVAARSIYSSPFLGSARSGERFLLLASGCGRVFRVRFGYEARVGAHVATPFARTRDVEMGELTLVDEPATAVFVDLGADCHRVRLIGDA